MSELLFRVPYILTKNIFHAVGYLLQSRQAAKVTSRKCRERPAGEGAQHVRQEVFVICTQAEAEQATGIHDSFIFDHV